nr:MAG TPA: hypothetical protein [Caudoviricetes sp.]
MDNDITTVDPVEQCFEHFGILGMKWGRRRSKKELQAARGTSKPDFDISEDERRYRNISEKSISEMSTKEIREWVNRQNAINDYNRLKMAQPTGQRFIDAVLSTSGKILIDTGKEIAKDELKRQVKKGVRSAGVLAMDAYRSR